MPGGLGAIGPIMSLASSAGGGKGGKGGGGGPFVPPQNPKLVAQGVGGEFASKGMYNSTNRLAGQLGAVNMASLQNANAATAFNQQMQNQQNQLAALQGEINANAAGGSQDGTGGSSNDPASLGTGGGSSGTGNASGGDIIT